MEKVHHEVFSKGHARTYSIIIPEEKFSEIGQILQKIIHDCHFSDDVASVIKDGAVQPVTSVQFLVQFT